MTSFAPHLDTAASDCILKCWQHVPTLLGAVTWTEFGPVATWHAGLPGEEGGNLSWCGLQHWEDGCASTTMLSNETTQNSDSFACWKSPLFPGTRALATWRDSFPNGGTLLTERDLRDFWANWRGGVRLVRFTTVDTGLVGGAARVTSETVNNSWRVFRSCHSSGSTRFLVEC